MTDPVSMIGPVFRESDATNDLSDRARRELGISYSVGDQVTRSNPPASGVALRIFERESWAWATVRTDDGEEITTPADNWRG